MRTQASGELGPVQTGNSSGAVQDGVTFWSHLASRSCPSWHYGRPVNAVAGRPACDESD